MVKKEVVEEPEGGRLAQLGLQVVIDGLQGK